MKTQQAGVCEALGRFVNVCDHCFTAVMSEFRRVAFVGCVGVGTLDTLVAIPWSLVSCGLSCWDILPENII